KRLNALGGHMRLNSTVTELHLDNDRVTAISGLEHGSRTIHVPTDYLIIALDVASCQKLVASSLSGYPYFQRVFNLATTSVLLTRMWIEGMPALTVSAGVIPDSRIVDTFLDVSQYQDGIAKPGIRVVETQSVGGPWMDEADSVVLGLVQADLAD